MSQVATVPGTLLGLFGGAAYFGSLDTDPTKPIMVRNLSFVRILLTLSRALTLLCFTARLPPCACVRVHLLVFSSNFSSSIVVGFMVAPTAGGAAWRLAKSSHIERFDSRDAEFFKRVAKHRVDASLASMTPPPDYYGRLNPGIRVYHAYLLPLCLR